MSQPKPNLLRIYPLKDPEKLLECIRGERWFVLYDSPDYAVSSFLRCARVVVRPGQAIGCLAVLRGRASLFHRVGPQRKVIQLTAIYDSIQAFDGDLYGRPARADYANWVVQHIQPGEALPDMYRRLSTAGEVAPAEVWSAIRGLNGGRCIKLLHPELAPTSGQGIVGRAEGGA